MKILVIGQCSLHWGRMEYGNIGNYYIIEPFFRELHEVFPLAEIYTTFQMSDTFCRKEKIQCLPLSYYYNWSDGDITIAYKELAISTAYNETGVLIDSTPFINEVLTSDLVVDFSGDIWGVNANFLGPNRFLIGLIKDRVVQLLKKPIAMLAGSPGPFDNDIILPFAKLVYKNFNIVTNREPISRRILQDYGFDLSKTKDYVCPAFSFTSASISEIANFIKGTPLEKKNKKVVGFILCGWNMSVGPYDRSDWSDDEFSVFIKVIRTFIKEKGVSVCLLSHSNGFKLEPKFQLIHGRDYKIVKRLFELLQRTDVSDNVFLFNDIYLPKVTKGIISMFDMLISGRVHGAVAGLSQNVPTVIIDYGHEPKAHKLKGFAQVAGIEEYVADPNNYDSLITKIDSCWEKKIEIKEKLKEKNIYIQQQLKEEFRELLKII